MLDSRTARHELDLPMTAMIEHDTLVGSEPAVIAE